MRRFTAYWRRAGRLPATACLALAIGACRQADPPPAGDVDRDPAGQATDATATGGQPAATDGAAGAANGERDDDSAGDSERSIAAATDPGARLVNCLVTEYRIELDADSVPGGRLQLAFDNRGERPHTIEVRGNNGLHWRTVPIRPRTAVALTIPVPPGTYTITSAEPAYVERGMRAVLVVR